MGGSNPNRPSEYFSDIMKSNIDTEDFETTEQLVIARSSFAGMLIPVGQWSSQKLLA